MFSIEDRDTIELLAFILLWKSISLFWSRLDESKIFSFSWFWLCIISGSSKCFISIVWIWFRFYKKNCHVLNIKSKQISLFTKLVNWSLNPFCSLIMIELSIIWANLFFMINWISSYGNFNLVCLPKNKCLSFRYEWKYRAWLDTKSFPCIKIFKFAAQEYFSIIMSLTDKN